MTSLDPLKEFKAVVAVRVELFLISVESIALIADLLSQFIRIFLPSKECPKR